MIGVKLFCSLLITILLCSTSSTALAFYKDRPDLWKHYGGSLFLSLIGANIAKNAGQSDRNAMITGFTFSMLAGLGKELSDDEFDWSDMGANTLGASSGIVIFITF